VKYLSPLVLQDGYYEEIEARINRIFEQAIFAPIFKMLREQKIPIHNASSPLEPIATAIRRGGAYVEDGVLKGEFSSRISKALHAIGARYDGRAKGWRFSGAMPSELQMALAHAEAQSALLQSNIVRALDSANVDKALADHPLSAAYDQTLGMMNTDFEDVVKSVAIPPKLTSQAKEAISKSWANNLDLYIKGWADEAILKLRGKVMDNTMRGQRSANMIKSIVEEYGVSQRKAKFLARQETSLLMSKFQEERYKDVGITKYRWSGSMDKRERHDHKLLEGKIISWDSPPITNRETGARNHAGQDFGCRCVAIPIVESAL
jgi:SPP1 gp7 family putative phage head morphogenesis protein